ncbi:hypothetical protein ACLOJK_008577, partial [Asimina triloba]
SNNRRDDGKRCKDCFEMIGSLRMRDDNNNGDEEGEERMRTMMTEEGRILETVLLQGSE